MHDILLVGLNHKSANVDIRERFALGRFCDAENWIFNNSPQIRESLILSTCNRVEAVLAGDGDLLDTVLECWARSCGSSKDELESYVYSYTGIEAVRHLFRVAGSLDSMILGEPQILGQLKNAYRQSAKFKKTGPILNRLLHKAFSVAKKIRTQTEIGYNPVSISYAAVELAKRIFGDMRGQSVLLIGAGEMAELAATHLLQAGVKQIAVANRTYEKALVLAQRFAGQAVPFDDLGSVLGQTDIVISSTSAENFVLSATDVSQALAVRKNRIMFLIDIAVPRDIDPDVNNLDNVYLYDIDDLNEIVESNIANRREEVAKAEVIIEEGLAAFSKWLKLLDVQPTILNLIHKSEKIASDELGKTLKNIGPVDDSVVQALQHMLNSVLHKVNHAPLSYLKGEGIGHESKEQRVNLVRRIFDLDSSL